MNKTLYQIVVLTLLVVTLSATTAQSQSRNVKMVGSLFSHWTYANNVVVVGKYAFIADEPAGLRIVDVADPTKPRDIGHLELFTSGLTNSNCIAVEGNYAYIATGNRKLIVIDISDLTNPQAVGFAWIISYGKDVAISGSYVYVANSFYVDIFDVSDPTSPVRVGQYYMAADVWSVKLSGGLAYFSGAGLRIVDVTNPSRPKTLGRCDLGGHSARWVEIAGDYAYVTCFEDGFYIVNISNSTNPYIVGYLQMPGGCNRVDVEGGYAYVADYPEGLRIINVVNPVSPVEVGYIKDDVYAYGVDVAAGFAYVAAMSSGLRIIDCSDPKKPIVSGRYSPEGGEIFDSAIYGDYAFVSDGKAGVQIVNIASPANPLKSGNIYIPGTNGNQGRAYGVAIEGNYLYVANQIAGLYMFDITNPVSPQRMGVFSSGATYDVAIADQKAYLAGGSLKIIDITDAMAPVLLGCYQTGNSVNSVTVSGQYAYMATDKNVVILDVSIPSTPILQGSILLPDIVRKIAIAGNYAYVVASSGGLRVVDISVPTKPLEVGFYEIGGYSFGITVAGNHAFVADAEAGLRVIDISDPTQPKESGFFDTQGLAYNVVVAGQYAYVADGVHFSIFDCSQVFVGVEAEKPVNVPFETTVHNPYPNPFNSSTTVPFTLAQTGVVRLTVWDINGRQEATIFEGKMSAGKQTVTWSADGLPAGIHIIKLEAGNRTLYTKTVLLR